MLSFFITSLLIALIPGPGVIYTISTGISYGKTKSLLAVIGCTLGIIPHLVLGVFGVTLFSKLSSEILALVQSIGACYLIYLGYKLSSQKTSFKINTTKKVLANRLFVIQPILINLLNPKLTLFFLSFLPQFVNNSHDTVYQTIRLGILFMILTFLVFLMYGLLSAQLSKLFLSRPKYLFNFQKLVGMIFIGYATTILLDVLTTVRTLHLVP
jgi:threonine/homoserine/homoserine lactone efflux protein